ncbi:MAG: ABC transporter ATP-binding protein/permease [Rhodoplanes sp.]|uniref:ABC transporter ATP-binding protein/permease n=1 Tax=Rhodoplanes sp. TaxID=1968906 RepID=UPI00183B9A01|nr:ABC transporter ATP-binding protein/permease [Rhodoplanes sp.]NVO17365.1 ABC transporter ATP-binding protein/permease [Rhodoplanes sp.]
MSRLIASLAVVWRLAAPYFRSEERRAGRALLASVIVIELGIVAITVLINQWNNRFYNALQERNWDTFVSELLLFCALAAAYILLAVYQLYLNQWLQIRWRRWMTGQYLSHWLEGSNHYRMQLLGDAADNPDQRIADDINLFIDRGLSIGLGLLNSVVTLGSFVAILWGLSEQAPLHIGGTAVSIPGYLVWAALLYAVVGTAFTHLIGRPLIRLNFQQQRYEADFRFNLVRVRENGEQIALLAGETAERARLLDRFAALMGNWYAIMSRQKKLTFFTAGFNQVSTIFPFVVVSPAYFAGAVNLGGLMQTASAFGSVQQALSFFVTSYRSLAEWKAVVDRLAGFDASIAAGRALAAGPDTIAVTVGDKAGGIAAERLDVRLPSGTPLVAAHGLALPAGERVLVNGPSGSGKSTLFRALAGVWPFGDGSVAVPAGSRVMVLPQRPYLPVGTLAAAVCYPALPDAFSRDKIAEVLAAVGLGALTDRIDEEAHWGRTLSLGEQQRIAVARAILQAPDYLLLDEATASLDEPSEAALYGLLRERLPGAALISIGHRSTLNALHDRNLVLERDGDGHRLREHTAAAAAE